MTSPELEKNMPEKMMKSVNGKSTENTNTAKAMSTGNIDF